MANSIVKWVMIGFLVLVGFAFLGGILSAWQEPQPVIMDFESSLRGWLPDYMHPMIGVMVVLAPALLYFLLIYALFLETGIFKNVEIGDKPEVLGVLALVIGIIGGFYHPAAAVGIYIITHGLIFVLLFIIAGIIFKAFGSGVGLGIGGIKSAHKEWKGFKKYLKRSIDIEEHTEKLIDKELKKTLDELVKMMKIIEQGDLHRLGNLDAIMNDINARLGEVGRLTQQEETGVLQTLSGLHGALTGLRSETDAETIRQGLLREKIVETLRRLEKHYEKEYKEKLKQLKKFSDLMKDIDNYTSTILAHRIPALEVKKRELQDHAFKLQNRIGSINDPMTREKINDALTRISHEIAAINDKISEQQNLVKKLEDLKSKEEQIREYLLMEAVKYFNLMRVFGALHAYYSELERILTDVLHIKNQGGVIDQTLKDKYLEKLTNAVVNYYNSHHIENEEKNLINLAWSQPLKDKVELQLQNAQITVGSTYDEYVRVSIPKRDGSVESFDMPTLLLQQARGGNAPADLRNVNW